MVARGGMLGWQGACMVAGVCAWLQGVCGWWGACMVAGVMCGCGGGRGHAGLGGMHGCGGHVWLMIRACVVVGGMHGCQGHAWLLGVWLQWGMHGCGGGMCGCQGGMCSCGVCVVAGGGACIGYDEIRSMSRQYASYWNAFLLSHILQFK